MASFRTAEFQGRARLILASGSPRRVALLQQVGVTPDFLKPTEIDETPHRREMARTLARRLSMEKAEAAHIKASKDETLDGCFILAADTVVTIGRRILPKTMLLDEASVCLRLLSGRAHRVYTGVCLVTPTGDYRTRLIYSKVRFKRLSEEEVEAYLASGEWRGKAGGYAIQGLAASFIVKLSGSYSNVVGLPIHETVQLLKGEGYPVYFNWLNMA
jgi:septum formation protein